MAHERSERARKTSRRSPGLDKLPLRLGCHGAVPVRRGSGPGSATSHLAYKHADWYVAEVVQLAARYGRVGVSGGGLIDGRADRPPLNQYDCRNYRSDQSCLTW